MPRITWLQASPNTEADMASMRPRRYAAENLGRALLTWRALRCFNEAAALCRGKLGDVRKMVAAEQMLQ